MFSLLTLFSRYSLSSIELFLLVFFVSLFFLEFIPSFSLLSFFGGLVENVAEGVHSDDHRADCSSSFFVRSGHYEIADSFED